MKLTLIGMSNVGKTYWSRKLEQSGFIRYSCDEMIEEKLNKELRKSGFRGIEDVAKWMGQPYERQYPTACKKYLDFENESLRKIIGNLKSKNKSGKDIVIDTTGSLIYCESKIINELRQLTTFVCLDSPHKVIVEMFNKYLKHPKPVIWGESFHKTNGESDFDALNICYPGLRNYRNNKYNDYAHLNLDYDLLHQPDFYSEDFLYELNIQLKNDSL